MKSFTNSKEVVAAGNIDERNAANRSKRTDSEKRYRRGLWLWVDRYQFPEGTADWKKKAPMPTTGAQVICVTRLPTLNALRHNLLIYKIFAVEGLV